MSLGMADEPGATSNHLTTASEPQQAVPEPVGSKLEPSTVVAGEQQQQQQEEQKQDSEQYHAVEKALHLLRKLQSGIAKDLQQRAGAFRGIPACHVQLQQAQASQQSNNNAELESIAQQHPGSDPNTPGSNGSAAAGSVLGQVEAACVDSLDVLTGQTAAPASAAAAGEAHAAVSVQAVNKTQTEGSVPCSQCVCSTGASPGFSSSIASHGSFSTSASRISSMPIQQVVSGSGGSFSSSAGRAGTMMPFQQPLVTGSDGGFSAMPAAGPGGAALSAKVAAIVGGGGGGVSTFAMSSSFSSSRGGSNGVCWRHMQSMLVSQEGAAISSSSKSPAEGAGSLPRSWSAAPSHNSGPAKAGGSSSSSQLPPAAALLAASRETSFPPAPSTQQRSISACVHASACAPVPKLPLAGRQATFAEGERDVLDCFALRYAPLKTLDSQVLPRQRRAAAGQRSYALQKAPELDAARFVGALVCQHRQMRQQQRHQLQQHGLRCDSTVITDPLGRALSKEVRSKNAAKST